MILRERSEFGWGESPADPARPRLGLVVHYNGRATNLDAHEDCLAYWQRVRDGHVNGNGWVDIGYSFGVCRHGEVFTGRGLDRYQAAQGTTAGNQDYYSVSFMLGAGEAPTGEQIAAMRQLREYLMGLGVGPAVRAHHEFYDTECPGPVLSELVTTGAFGTAAVR